MMQQAGHLGNVMWYPASPSQVRRLTSETGRGGSDITVCVTIPGETPYIREREDSGFTVTVKVLGKALVEVL